MNRRGKTSLIFALCVGLFSGTGLTAQEISATAGIHPNLVGHIGRPLRYHPENGDFVITNGQEFFNRSLYGGNTAFRIVGGDKPEFLLYLPGRGGNLRFGLEAWSTLKWLKDAATIVTRYRPGELIYEIRDPAFGAKAEIKLEVLAYADTEGLAVRITGNSLPRNAHLIWAYGGVNGKRGARDGDIGTEPVPISQYFQFQPAFAAGNTFSFGNNGFTLNSSHATIVGVTPAGARQHAANANDWNHLPALVHHGATSAEGAVIVGLAPISSGAPMYFSLQRVEDGTTAAGDLDVYREVTSGSAQVPAKAAPLPPAFTRAELPAEFANAQKHFDALRTKVQVTTPDPYINASVGALNVVSDALWDSNAKAIMHGAIAWRVKLLGWRGPYVLDDLGWHERARQNFETWFPHQNTSPIGPIPPPDPRAHLARNEPGLHSNGDLSHSHYDMNAVFIDALMRHLLWTGDTALARQAWPVIQRHLAWEKRLFRREYGPQKLPLYEAYADIWASDNLYYNGGGSAYASAYNVFANRMAARIAVMVGQDPKPYLQEASDIEMGMQKLLWLPREGAFAEYKDLLGRQLVHRDYGLWTFYHTVDEEAVSPREMWRMGADVRRHFHPIPVEGTGVPNDLPYHVLSETDWMPYAWSINNVVMDENMHTALALWESGHSRDAFEVAKGALLASMFMGISPGNVGTMDYLDVYRRESQSDFGDGAGIMSRAMIEGLFGIHPDALAGVLTISPGFPESWKYARLKHPDIEMAFARHGMDETWDIRPAGHLFQKVILKIPARFSDVAKVMVNGAKAQWRSAPDAVGRPLLEVVTATDGPVHLQIRWEGKSVSAATLAQAKSSETAGYFKKMSLGAFTWWAAIPQPLQAQPMPVVKTVDWRTPIEGAHFRQVDLSRWFNDRVTDIFAAQKYLAPRSQTVSLELPWQGAGAWAGELNLLPKIDDSGLRKVAAEDGGRIVMPNGVALATPGTPAANNIVFTSQWNNYPDQVTIPLGGRARHAYFLMAGSTNFMQTRMDNGEVVIHYADGSSARLALRNPQSWWPIEQDYFIDDYQFPLSGPLPPRIDLQTGKVRILDAATFKGKGREVPGGAATVLDLPLDPCKELRSVTVRTLANDVVIGLMSMTLESPE